MRKYNSMWKEATFPDIVSFRERDVYLITMHGWMKWMLRGNTKRLSIHDTIDQSFFNDAPKVSFRGYNRTKKGQNWGFFTLTNAGDRKSLIIN